jgi:hypothetical protein
VMCNLHVRERDRRLHSHGRRRDRPSDRTDGHCYVHQHDSWDDVQRRRQLRTPAAGGRCRRHQLRGRLRGHRDPEPPGDRGLLGRQHVPVELGIHDVPARRPGRQRLRADDPDVQSADDQRDDQRPRRGRDRDDLRRRDQRSH